MKYWKKTNPAEQKKRKPAQTWGEAGTGSIWQAGEACSGEGAKLARMEKEI